MVSPKNFSSCDKHLNLGFARLISDFKVFIPLEMNNLPEATFKDRTGGFNKLRFKANRNSSN